MVRRAVVVALFLALAVTPTHAQWAVFDPANFAQTVLIAQRTLFQVREDYLNALVDLRQNATQIEGFLLTGALDAPRQRGGEREGLETGESNNR